jgi:lysophospholipase L1-like esterase
MLAASCAASNLTTTNPVPSPETRSAAAGWHDGRTWLDQHEDTKRIGLSHRVDVVFLGDSITQSFGGAGRRIGTAAGNTWNDFFAPFHPANFGISGDRTQHVLWRIDNGCLDHVDPGAVVVLIGTNNLPHDPAEAIAAGIEAIVTRLQETVPEATILLLGILPRGQMPDDPLRTKAECVNKSIESLDDKPSVRFLDISDRFLLSDGRANPELMRSDFVHLTEAGYRVLAGAVAPVLHELVVETVP